MPERPAAASRPEIVLRLAPSTRGLRRRGAAARHLGAGCTGTARSARRALLVLLAAAWELYARALDNPLLFPTFSATVGALLDGDCVGRDPARGRVHAVAAAQGLCRGSRHRRAADGVRDVSRIGADLLETLTAMFNPLPSIALLPLALIWFGLGDGSVIFVLVHAVLWAVALNTFAGFRALSPTLGWSDRTTASRGSATSRGS